MFYDWGPPGRFLKFQKKGNILPHCLASTRVIAHALQLPFLSALLQVSLIKRAKKNRLLRYNAAAGRNKERKRGFRMGKFIAAQTSSSIKKPLQLFILNTVPSLSFYIKPPSFFFYIRIVNLDHFVMDTVAGDVP